MQKDDVIYKQAAIDAIKKHYRAHDNDLLELIAFDIEQLPSAQQWIPCSERLPEDNRQVLVYACSVHFALAKYDEMRDANGIYKMQWVTYDAWKPLYKIKDVIAWMPLPESYRGANE